MDGSLSREVEQAKLLIERETLSSKERFEDDLSNSLVNAWTTRSLERYLYTVYSHILSHLCGTIQPQDYPISTISYTPQAFFGITRAPAGVKGDKLDKEDFVKAQVPDFVRMLMTFSNDGDDIDVVRKLVDLWEIKGLVTRQVWDHPGTVLTADDIMLRCVGQLYDQAMAAFKYHETWQQHVYALLIIGSYFSQLVWSRPTAIKKPIEAETFKYTPKEDVLQYARTDASVIVFIPEALPPLRQLSCPPSSSDRLRARQAHLSDAIEIDSLSGRTDFYTSLTRTRVLEPSTLQPVKKGTELLFRSGTPRSTRSSSPRRAHRPYVPTHALSDFSRLEPNGLTERDNFVASMPPSSPLLLAWC
ncbi:hypothetical protein BD309DRAFT_1024388 [Dichomitus squalens]|nr:hypothetical protein BD309DRAFT_1024388 [Dichomitus squalens]